VKEANARRDSKLYDGLGERVANAGSKLYWKGVGSTALVETNVNDQNPTMYIFFNGARIARIDPGAAAKYYVTDNVGSTEVETDSSGNVLNNSLFFPYGVERIVQQSDTANNYRFSGKERDPQTGLDDFGARYYDSVLGRFMTPDWDAKPTAVPYASFGDPQTLNLYSYVENGPLNRVDADGHADQETSPKTGSAGPAENPSQLCGFGGTGSLNCVTPEAMSATKDGSTQATHDAQVNAQVQHEAGSTGNNMAQQQPIYCLPKVQKEIKSAFDQALRDNGFDSRADSQSEKGFAVNATTGTAGPIASGDKNGQLNIPTPPGTTDTFHTHSTVGGKDSGLPSTPFDNVSRSKEKGDTLVTARFNVWVISVHGLALAPKGAPIDGSQSHYVFSSNKNNFNEWYNAMRQSCRAPAP
jgi:RHS repeat-associated protein